MTMTPNKFTALAKKAFKATGLKPIVRLWYAADATQPCGCVLAAIFLEQVNENRRAEVAGIMTTPILYDEAAELLDESRFFVAGVENGWDDIPPTMKDRDYRSGHACGQAARREIFEKVGGPPRLGLPFATPKG